MLNINFTFSAPIGEIQDKKKLPLGAGELHCL